MSTPLERPTAGQLNDDASRLASALARLGDQASAQQLRPNLRAPTAEEVAEVIRLRRFRGTLIAKELFSDPAWDLMLVLLHRELLHRPIAISELGEVARIRPTTALRWLATLADHNLVLRYPDVHDSRRVFVQLAPAGRDALHLFFAELRATFEV